MLLEVIFYICSVFLSFSVTDSNETDTHFRPIFNCSVTYFLNSALSSDMFKTIQQKTIFQFCVMVIKILTISLVSYMIYKCKISAVCYIVASIAEVLAASISKIEEKSSIYFILFAL